MSWLHFTATKQYRNRVIQLGENPARVFNVGGLGVDRISKTKLHSKSFLEKKYSFKFKKYNFLVTLHPVTLEKDLPAVYRAAFESILKIYETNILYYA